jgi:phosphoserine phosphatase RsbU/P
VTKPLDFPVVLARVRTQLLLKHSFERNHDLERRLSARNAELESAAEATHRDLQAAAMIQRSYLPRTAPENVGMRFAWKFNPCEALAGDSLNICPLTEDHVAIYVLDVAGHGVAAALLAVAATRALSPATDPHSLLLDRANKGAGSQPFSPVEIADRLNKQFAWDAATNQFLTIFYSVVNTKTGQCRYVSAGHPVAIHLPKEGAAIAVPGEGSGLPLQPGDRLYLYSDGVMEAMRPDREMFGRPRLLQSLEKTRGKGLGDSVSLLVDEIDQWCVAPPKDDISVLAIERE